MTFAIKKYNEHNNIDEINNFFEDIKNKINIYSHDKWRYDRFFNEDVDKILKSYKSLLKQVFNNYKFH